MVTATTADAPVRSWRSYTLDGFRGLAILCMVVDHLTLALDGPVALRLTVGRLAMPMFFLLAGHLCRRLSWRTLGVFALGTVLPVFAPWVDNPNVLVWWALGCAVIVLCRYCGVPVWLVAAVGLASAANGWVDMTGLNGGVTYDARCLWGLMALGSLLPLSAFSVGRYAPRWVSWLGSHPVSFYVGHVLAITAAYYALTGHMLT